MASLVVLCAGSLRAEGDEAPLVLGGSVPLIGRWSLPRPAAERTPRYATSGWFDLLIASGTRLAVIDRASGRTRASFDVGCEVRELTRDLVLCPDEVRWIADLRAGLFVPLHGLPSGVERADSRGENAAVISADAAFLFRLPSKLELESPSGEVAAFRLNAGFPAQRVSFAGYDVVVVEGAEGERAFFHSSSGRPLDPPPPSLEQIHAHTLLDERGARPAAVAGALQADVFLSPPRWERGGVLLHVRDALLHEGARELLVIENASGLSGSLLYLVDDEGVHAYSTSLLAPSAYEPKGPVFAAGLLDPRSLVLLGSALAASAAAPALLWALQPDLGQAAVGIGLLTLLAAVPAALGTAAVGTGIWLLTLALTPRPRAHTGSGCLDAGLDPLMGAGHACATAVAAAAAIPLLVVGSALIVAVPLLLVTVPVNDPAFGAGAIDPALFTLVTSAATLTGAAATYGGLSLLPLPDDEDRAVVVVVGRLLLSAAVAGVAGAGAYGITRGLVR